MHLIAGLSAALFVALSATASLAGQTQIHDFDTARDRFFWPKLYKNGGFTLYCGQWFANNPRLDGKFAARPGLKVEQVYPASWMLETAGCANRTRSMCRHLSQDFNLMEADLHNLYPAISFINQARSNYEFADIPGEDHMYDSCDFEVFCRTAEPRPEARGNVARAIFYMHHEYGLPVPDAMKSLLLEWNADDPVSEAERRRNAKIEELQGTRNPFIDNPGLAATLGF